MDDRKFFDSKHSHSRDRNNPLLDQCSNSEFNAKHCSKKQNLPFNSDVSDRQIRKQSSSEEDNGLDMASNFLMKMTMVTTLVPLKNQKIDPVTFSGTHAVEAISSLFRNANSENRKDEIAVGYQFHSHTTTNFNNITRSFTCGTDSTCHHHSQQLIYTGHMPVSSHYVVSCSMLPSNSTTGSNESSYERVNSNSIPISTTTIANGTVNRNENQQSLNTAESFIRPAFNSSKPTICNFGLSRTVCGNFGHSLPSLYGMPILASETFCAVPGRTSLLSSTTKYQVTIGEIYRRISPPECLNASLLGGILRKAKSKDGGKTLRDSLKRVGLTLPAGRRRAATVTAWTALVEEEALQMAKDFAALSEKAFPIRQIAEFICNRMIWQDDPNECCTFIEHIRLFIKELSDIINGEYSGTVFGNQPNPNALVAPAMQHGLAHFSLLTHGFGPLAFATVFDTLIALFNEILKYCDRNEQHLNIPLSEISVTHTPSGRFTYGNNI
ncbi:Transcription factor AP-2-epsilon [Dirofilaria immitis]|nr:Transcription factor AP-2-epsilon [Dirofilaria immitis]